MIKIFAPRRGFTLIELLIVVAIVSVFAAGSFSLFGRAIRMGSLLEIDADLAEQLTLAEYALVRDCVPGRALDVSAEGILTIRDHNFGDGEPIVWKPSDGKLTRSHSGANQVFIRDLDAWNAVRVGDLVRISIEASQPFGEGRRSRSAEWAFESGEGSAP